MILAFKNYDNSLVLLENGYYFDMTVNLFFKNGKFIELTKTEKMLFNLLLQRQNKVVSYKTIEKVVWSGKKFSIFTLRNMVKRIREKSDDLIIKNASKTGYILNTF